MAESVICIDNISRTEYVYVLGEEEGETMPGWSQARNAD